MEVGAMQLYLRCTNTINELPNNTKARSRRDNLFGALGLVGLKILVAKILTQDLWQEKI